MTDKLQIVFRKTSDLIPYARNSRIHSDAQILQIAASIKEFGFTNPILIDGENGIIAGHGRVLAAMKLSINDVPCIELSGMTDTQKRAYIIADNKLALNAEWDNDFLAVEFKELDEAGFDVGLTGFSLDEIADLLPEEIPVGLTDEDYVPEVQHDPVSKPGDVWLLGGKHRVMCGDSTSIDSVEVLMDGVKADMVFIDPPYGVSIVNVKKGKEVGGSGVVDAKEYAEIIGDETTETARNFYNTCVAAGHRNFIIWGGNYFTDFLDPSPCWIVWDKQNSGNFADVELAWCSSDKSAKLYSFTWNGMSRQGNRKDELSTRVHPTQKPVGLFENIFNDFEFETCFDGFLGSGTTLIACEKTNKICYGMEMSEHYCDVIVKRWQEFTGRDAIHEQSGGTFNSMMNDAKKH